MVGQNKIRLGMHGFGIIGRVHWLALQTCRMVPGLMPESVPEVDFSDCVVRNADSESGVIANRAFRQVHTGLESFDMRSIDALDVVSSNDVHGVVVNAALRANIPVYCEKPLASNIEDSREMVRIATQSNVIHQVALLNRFHPAVEEANHWLKSGILGDVLTFRASLLHGSYLDPNRKMSWRLQKHRSGGGAILDLGVHMIDLIQMLLGRIVSVDARLETFVSQRANVSGEIEPVEVDDWALLRVALENGAVGTVEASRVHLGAEQNEVQIVCRIGTIHIDLNADRPPKIETLDHNVPFGKGAGESTDLGAGAALPSMQAAVQVKRPLAAFRLPPKYSSDAFLKSHATSLLCFLHRVAGCHVDYPVPTFTDALSSEEVVYAARLSSETGRAVEIPRCVK